MILNREGKHRSRRLTPCRDARPDRRSANTDGQMLIVAKTRVRARRHRTSRRKMKAIEERLRLQEPTFISL